MTAISTPAPVVPGRLEQMSTRIAFFIAGFGIARLGVTGGALMPYLMGKVADNSTVALAYLLPMGCFVVVAVYARSRLRHP